MANLDVSPLISALRHIPSGHGFRFDASDNLEVSAACNCVLLAPTPQPTVTPTTDSRRHPGRVTASGRPQSRCI